MKDLITDDREQVSLVELMGELSLDRSAVSRRVALARDRGYLRNLETKKGKAARLVLGDPLPKNVEILPNPTAIAEALHPCNADQEDTDPPSPQPTKCVQCDEPIPSGEQTVQVAGNWVLHPRCYDDYMGFDRSKDDKRGTDIPDIPPILDRRQRPIRPHTEKIEK